MLQWLAHVLNCEGFCLTTTCSKLICLFFPACKFLVNMMSNTKFRCVPCVIDSYPIYGSGSNPCSLCWEQHTQTWGWGRSGGAGWVCAWLFLCFFPLWKWDPQLRVCQHTPVLGGKVAWQLLWWLSDINDFGHFCGRRGSSCRYVAIAEVETIS